MSSNLQADSISLREFLESVPPQTARKVNDIEYTRFAGNQRYFKLAIPSISLMCETEDCDKQTWFDCSSSGVELTGGKLASYFLLYTCRHCQRQWKRYALSVQIGNSEETTFATITKFGEIPEFGEHLPTNLKKVLGRDEFFRRGWKAEREGLGIGAFAYYRRVVESHKNTLFDLVRSVAELEGADEHLLAQIDAAKKETQFDKAVEMIKAGLPSSLRYGRHSPLQLLHEALSQGLHAESDETCLELASAIRRVLAFLTERAAAVAKDHGELKQSVSRLLEVQRERRSKRD